jgi:hypothetical protein
MSFTFGAICAYRLDGGDSLGVDVGPHSRLVHAHSQRPVQELSVS